MYHKIVSGAYHGMDSFLVDIEVDISSGLPGMDMVGSLASEVKETRERVRVGLKNSGFEMPIKRVTVSFSPADVRKDGSGFDLPVALGILGATVLTDDLLEKENGRKETEALKDEKYGGDNKFKNVNENESKSENENENENESVSENENENVMVLGEIGLDGMIKGVKGILPILLKGVENKITNCILPYDNRLEASNVKEMTLYPVKTLQEAFYVYKSLKQPNKAYVTGDTLKKKNDNTVENKNVLDTFRFDRKIDNMCDINANNADYQKEKCVEKLDFWQVVGQEHAKRAAMIAAAGFHNLLLFGPPGSGKSMLAKRIPSIMKTMEYEECLDVTKIYSVAGLMNKDTALITNRPVMSPHHTISEAALVGGGSVPKPGLVTLAHKGILFLDELPEFGRTKLDLLRQPLEDKVVQISRMNYTCEYQADFMLVAAMNPCPCGFYPDRNKCNCSPHDIKRYLSRISGPLLDRIDLSVEVGRMEWEQIAENTASIHKQDKTYQQSEMNVWGSAYMKRQVQQAFDMQSSRGQKKYNSGLNGEEIQKICVLDQEAEQFLRFAFEKMHLSMRSVMRLKRVARTIADLDGKEKIEQVHISEAVMLNKGLERVREGYHES